MRPNVFIAAALLSVAASARAEVKTKVVDYAQGDTPLQGFLAWDDAAPGKRPGVLVAHEWWGQNEHARAQAVRAAKAGYVGLALDLYGKGKVTTHPKDAQAFAKEANKDPAALRARFDAALALLKAQPQVDASKIAVLGYCFGGGVALDMVRTGADLDAVAVFHPTIPSPGEPIRSVKPRILIAAGGADPMVPRQRVEAFAKDLKDAGATVTLVFYPGAKHAFTNPASDRAGVEGLAYDEDADRKSWDAAMKMFREVFKS
jgi:dienelactone hydrolase